MYEGQDPQIHVADPELVRLIFVKDFDYFHDRRHMDFGSDVFNEILDYLPGMILFSFELHISIAV